MKSKLLLGSLLLMCATTWADEIKKVTVSGQCTVEITPDRGSVVFVSQNLNQDVTVAVRKATELNEKLRAEFKKLNVKDLELVSNEYTVQERKEWEHNKNVSKGFVARLGLKAITSDIPAIGQLLATAGKLGVTETHSLMSYVSDAKWMKEKSHCLEVAASNARAKAHALVTALDASLGRVLQITEKEANETPPIQPMMMERAMLKSSADSAPVPTIEGAKQKLIQDVEVSFEITK